MQFHTTVRLSREGCDEVSILISASQLKLTRTASSSKQKHFTYILTKKRSQQEPRLKILYSFKHTGQSVYKVVLNEFACFMENKLDDTNYTKKMQSDNVQGFLPDQTGNCQHIKKKKSQLRTMSSDKKRKRKKNHIAYGHKNYFIVSSICHSFTKTKACWQLSCRQMNPDGWQLFKTFNGSFLTTHHS